MGKCSSRSTLGPGPWEGPLLPGRSVLSCRSRERTGGAGLQRASPEPGRAAEGRRRERPPTQPAPHFQSPLRHQQSSAGKNGSIAQFYRSKLSPCSKKMSNTIFPALFLTILSSVFSCELFKPEKFLGRGHTSLNISFSVRFSSTSPGKNSRCPGRLVAQRWSACLRLRA